MSVAEIRLQEGESVENALRRFKRKFQSENIIGEVKRHSYYLKPGEKRRVKQALARKRVRKKFRKDFRVSCNHYQDQKRDALTLVKERACLKVVFQFVNPLCVRVVFRQFCG